MSLQHFRNCENQFSRSGLGQLLHNSKNKLSYNPVITAQKNFCLPSLCLIRWASSVLCVLVCYFPSNACVCVCLRGCWSVSTMRWEWEEAKREKWSVSSRRVHIQRDPVTLLNVCGSWQAPRGVEAKSSRSRGASLERRRERRDCFSISI